jgi:hypothetical protein
MSANVKAAVGERGVPSTGGRPPWRWSGRRWPGAPGRRSIGRNNSRIIFATYQ